MADRDPLLELLDRLDALEAKATPGPWEADPDWPQTTFPYRPLDIEAKSQGTVASIRARAHIVPYPKGEPGWTPTAQMALPEKTRQETRANAGLVEVLRNAYPTLARVLRLQRVVIEAHEDHEVNCSCDIETGEFCSFWWRRKEAYDALRAEMEEAADG